MGFIIEGDHNISYELREKSIIIFPEKDEIHVDQGTTTNVELSYELLHKIIDFCLSNDMMREKFNLRG